MDEKKIASRRQIVIGWIFFIFFALLVFLGIGVKRFFGHPEFMMLFHLPAALFLVLALRNLTTQLRERYKRDTQEDQLSNQEEL